MRICSKVERYKQLLFFKGLGGYNKFVAESLLHKLLIPAAAESFSGIERLIPL